MGVSAGLLHVARGRAGHSDSLAIRGPSSLGLALPAGLGVDAVLHPAPGGTALTSLSQSARMSFSFHFST